MGCQTNVLLLALAAAALLTGAMQAQVRKDMDADSDFRPKPGHGYNKSAPGEVFFVHAASRGGATVRLPWMKFFWATNRQDVLAFKAAYNDHLSRRAETPLPLSDGKRLFSGHDLFTEALTHNLSPNMETKLHRCPLGYPERGSTKPRGHLWLFVNGQSSSGTEFWESVKDVLDPQDKALILGNWWNETHESFRSHEVTSLWVPYASLSFAERTTRTPMDLVERVRKTRFDKNRTHQLAYQQQACLRHREAFWDLLNRELASRGQQGQALSQCNGFRDSGERLNLAEGNGARAGSMESSIMKYEAFKFVVTAEARQNSIGYISEKIVDALLAGSVPIYAGAAQVGQVFNPDNFVQVDITTQLNQIAAVRRAMGVMDDPAKYLEMQGRKRPAVSEAAMQKFFSWHPDVWGTYGDGLRQLILSEAVRLCREV